MRKHSQEYRCFALHNKYMLIFVVSKEVAQSLLKETWGITDYQSFDNKKFSGDELDEIKQLIKVATKKSN